MKCSETGCSHAATHVPKLCVPAMGWPQDETRALSLMLGAPMCRRHCEAFTPDNLLDVPNEKGATVRNDLIPAMARLTGSRIPPDCDRAWVVPVRMDSPAYRDFEAIQRKRGDA